MYEPELELSKCLFFHRRSHVHLLATSHIAVRSENECRPDASQTESSLRLWFPRARNLHLSFHLSIADDLNFVANDGGDPGSLVADHIQNAEVSNVGL